MGFCIYYKDPIKFSFYLCDLFKSPIFVSSTKCFSPKLELRFCKSSHNPLGLNNDEDSFIYYIFCIFSSAVESANLDVSGCVQGTRIPSVECQVFSTRLLLCFCCPRQNCPSLVHRQPSAPQSLRRTLLRR